MSLPVRWSRLCGAAALVVLLYSCAALPGPVRRDPPSWVLQPPPADGQHEYFVVSATDPDGNLGAAEEAAALALLTQINQALGVDVAVLTTADARSSLDSFRVGVVQQVTQSGSGRVDGLRVADRFIVEHNGRTTVHLLGAYEQNSFQAERAARQRFFRQREALYLGPEAAAGLAASDGRVLDALIAYVQAASAAADAERDGIASAGPVVLRSLQSAVALSGGLSVDVLDGPDRVPVGERAPQPIRFAVSDASGRAVIGTPVELSYREQVGGRSVVRTVQLVTDSAGVVTHHHPVATAVGEVTVTARVESGRMATLVTQLPESVSAQARALQEALASARATHSFTVLSRAREFVTSVIVVDTDASGLAMPESRTAEGVTEALSTAGFLLSGSDVDPLILVGRSAAESAVLLQSLVPSRIERAVIGTATIAEWTERDGYIVRVSGWLCAVDLNTGAILASVSGIRNAQSSTSTQAMRAAFLSLGRMLGRELAATMP